MLLVGPTMLVWDAVAGGYSTGWTQEERCRFSLGAFLSAATGTWINTLPETIELLSHTCGEGRDWPKQYCQVQGGPCTNPEYLDLFAYFQDRLEREHALVAAVVSQFRCKIEKLAANPHDPGLDRLWREALRELETVIDLAPGQYVYLLPHGSASLLDSSRTPQVDAPRFYQCVYEKSRVAAANYAWDIFIDEETRHVKPSANLFTKFLSGLAQPPYQIVEVVAQGSDLPLSMCEYAVFGNKPENDAAWDKPDSGVHASMSLHHKFLVPRNLADPWFGLNAATMEPTPETLTRLLDMKALATEYACQQWGLDSQQVGLYFHCFPKNSVHWLHFAHCGLDAHRIHV